MTKRIAILSASWHTDIVNAAERGFFDAVGDVETKVIKVPGSLEIPLAGKLVLENGFDLAVGIGFVTDGKVYHREYVAHTVVQSILDVSVAVGKPFLSVVLAPQDFEEGNAAHEAWFTEHMVGKGAEAAKAALQMLDVVAQIKSAS